METLTWPRTTRLNMYRIALQVVFAIVACTPLVLLVFDMLQRYPLETDVTAIGLLDAILLLVAIGLPVFALPRLGVDWRTEAEDYRGKPGN